VIGNGDVVSPESAKKMLETTGCDAVMIARGAEGNPWIFKSVIEYLRSGILLPEPSYEEKIEMALYHLEQTILLKGENIGIKEMRKHIAWYIKGLPGSAIIKTEVFKLDKEEDVKKMLHSYLLDIKQ
jgi:tRNA-dihydrouridine synthase